MRPSIFIHPQLVHDLRPSFFIRSLDYGLIKADRQISIKANSLDPLGAVHGGRPLGLRLDPAGERAPLAVDPIPHRQQRSDPPAAAMLRPSSAAVIAACPPRRSAVGAASL